MRSAPLEQPSDDSFRLLVEAVTDYAIFLLTPTGEVASWNAGAERLKGYTADEIIGQHFSRFYTQPDRDAGLPERLLAKAVECGRVENSGVRVRRDGSLFWAHVTITALRDANGLRGFAKVTRDISEVKQKADVLRREAEQRAAFMRVQTEIASADLDPEVLTRLVAERTRELTGADSASVERLEDGAQPPRPAEASGADGSLVAVPIMHRGTTMGVLKVVSRAPHALDTRTRSTVQVLAGLLGAALAHANALAERKRAEDAATRVSEYLSQVLRAATETCIIGTDRKGIITIFNSGAERMLGYRADEVIGRTTPLLFFRQDEILRRARELGVAPAPAVVAWATVRHKEAESREWTMVRKDGSELIVTNAVSPIRDEQGELIGYVSIGTNVTERRAVERMKEEFVSTVSHELRTPLTSLRASIGLLASGLLTQDPARSQHMLEIALSNAERLQRLVNDILDVERLQSGRVELVRQECDLRDLTEQAVETMRGMAERARVGIELEAPRALFVWGDPDRLIQVVTNLLSNAIKFSFGGGCIRVDLRQQDGSAFLRVRDQGRGIPRDKLEAVFERFQQVDASDSNAKGGTGLGLTISRAIVQQHAGRIWAESPPGSGATFCVVLPLITQPGDSD